MRQRALISALGLLILSTVSCGEEITLDRSDRRTVDTHFRNLTDPIIDQTDSVCHQLRDSLYPLWLDSVLEERKTEREQILKNRR